MDEWDSGLLIFLGRTLELATQQDLELQTIDLPDGAAKLLQLAVAVPEKKDARKAPEHKSFFVHLGDQTVDFIEGCGDLLEFVGEATMALSKFIRGKAQYRRSDLALILESCSRETQRHNNICLMNPFGCVAPDSSWLARIWRPPLLQKKYPVASESSWGFRTKRF